MQSIDKVVKCKFFSRSLGFSSHISTGCLLWLWNWIFYTKCDRRNGWQFALLTPYDECVCVCVSNPLCCIYRLALFALPSIQNQILFFCNFFFCDFQLLVHLYMCARVFFFSFFVYLFFCYCCCWNRLAWILFMSKWYVIVIVFVPNFIFTPNRTLICAVFFSCFFFLRRKKIPNHFFDWLMCVWIKCVIVCQ